MILLNVLLVYLIQQTLEYAETISLLKKQDSTMD